ncbi:hypothetical protein DFH08DRAFT_937503 [Mycena albidolilacea]|uniref:Uncharacterized protein n=1 Tax=Mycena albidolilacea TaxID=1033008 RepID=A0AAD6ZZ01_9AGAR|nr:hypothetical protein DFH08DRAFT_937503 [Mycena albidolilacea]
MGWGSRMRQSTAPKKLYKAEPCVRNSPRSRHLPTSIPASMSFTTTFVTLILAAFATAKPTTNIVSPFVRAGFLLPRDDGLVTFCFADGSCFQAAASDSAGCVDLPLFSDNFVTASVSASGIECILSPERGCVGSPFLPPFVLDTSGTVELSTLGLPTVASFLCTSDIDLINLCFSNTTLGCFQASTKIDGCSNLPQFSSDLTFGSVFLTTPGTECTLFQDSDCAGDSAPFANALVTTAVSSLGLSNVESFSCV